MSTFDKLFDPIVDASPNTFKDAMIIIISSLLLGFLTSIIYILTNKKNGYSSSLALSLIFLPPIMAVVMFLISSNTARALGAMGVFSIVRFRSAPADPKDLTYIFLALVSGIGCGIGYVGFSVLLVVLMSLVFFVVHVTKYAAPRPTNIKLRITVPEDLNFNNLFDDIFEKYTNSARLHRIKTREFGSLFELQYSVIMKHDAYPKDMIDEIRCRNGNLEISYILSQFADRIFED
jgi:hypothetical protein